MRKAKHSLANSELNKKFNSTLMSDLMIGSLSLTIEGDFGLVNKLCIDKKNRNLHIDIRELESHSYDYMLKIQLYFQNVFSKKMRTQLLTVQQNMNFV